MYVQGRVSAMPKLMKPDLVTALREKVAGMTGTDAEIALALNALLQ